MVDVCKYVNFDFIFNEANACMHADGIDDLTIIEGWIQNEKLFAEAKHLRPASGKFNTI